MQIESNEANKWPPIGPPRAKHLSNSSCDCHVAHAHCAAIQKLLPRGTIGACVFIKQLLPRGTSGVLEAVKQHYQLALVAHAHLSKSCSCHVAVYVQLSNSSCHVTIAANAKLSNRSSHVALLVHAYLSNSSCKVS